MILRIADADIKGASSNVCDSRDCPVARAFKRLLNRDDISVGVTGVTIGGDIIYGHMVIPTSLQKYICEYILEHTAKPAEFELPDEFLPYQRIED